MNLQQKHIAVLMGGPGNEREVSLNSGKSVVRALQSLGATVSEVDVTGDVVILPDDVEIGFNVIHGTFGEDGTLQAQMEEKGMPYTGAGVESSRIAFDKFLSKEKFVEAKVPTPLSQVFDLHGETAPPFEFPLVVKPPREGSSVGVHIVRDQAGWDAALVDCRRFGDTALVEQFIEGKELTVAILGDKALPVVHIQPVSGFYDMSNKYPWMNKGGKTNYFCPAEISPEATSRVQDAALAAHRSLGVEVYSRVDVILDANDNPWVLEVNTIPGMTESSLLPKAAAAGGIPFPELCAEIIRLSLLARPNI